MARPAGDAGAALDGDANATGDERRRESTNCDADDLDEKPIQPRTVPAEVTREVGVRLRTLGRERRDDARAAARERAGRSQAASHDDERGKEHEPNGDTSHIWVGVRSSPRTH